MSNSHNRVFYSKGKSLPLPLQGKVLPWKLKEIKELISSGSDLILSSIHSVAYIPVNLLLLIHTAACVHMHYMQHPYRYVTSYILCNHIYNSIYEKNKSLLK